MALCEAYNSFTQDIVNGTSQTSNTMWDKVWFNFAARTPTNMTAAEMRGRSATRPPSSAKTEFFATLGHADSALLTFILWQARS